MDNQIEMFPLADFEEPTHQDDGDLIAEDPEHIPETNTIESISNSGEARQQDGAEIAVPDPQGSTEPDGAATIEQVSLRLRQMPSPDDTDGTGCELADVPARERIDDRAGIAEEHGPDPTEIAATNPQGSSEPASDSARNGDLIPAEETSSIYEATGLIGPFKLNPIALIFPESPEDLADLAANIEAIGVLEEPTVAWTQGTENPPEVIDGKRLIQAAEIVGIQPTYRLLSRDIDPRDYVWAKNGERRNLTPSQKAVAFAALFPKRGTGRPPAHGRNCVNSDNFSSPTQGQGARAQGVGRTLINLAYQLVDPNAGVAPEIRDAVKDGTVSINDALSEKVVSASQEVLRQALSQVKDGSSRTIARAVDKLAKEEGTQLDQKPLSRLHTPTRFGKDSQFYCCPVGDLQRSVKPGTVDLILVHLPDHVRVGFYSQIAKLAAHVLCDSGVLVVAVVATGALPERLDRISRAGLEFIFESSLLFPAPVAELGDPHYTDIRRVALLVFGKHAAALPPGDDVIEVPASAHAPEDGPMEITDGLPLVLSRFASPGQVVCIPTLSDNRGAVVAAVASNCTVIAADEDQSVIDDIISELSHLTSDPSSMDPETG